MSIQTAINNYELEHKWVGGEGPINAKLMVVGEAPGKYEDENGRPFVGPSGKLFDEILRDCHIERSEVYITNVVKLRPPDNDLGRVEETGHDIAYYESLLWDEIRTINPNTILALGGTALRTLTGKEGITKWRGSILPSKEGYPKIVGTLHPANFIERADRGADGLYKWGQLAYVHLDFERAIIQSAFQEFRLPQRNLWVCRSTYDLMKYLDRNRNETKVAVDIETFKTIPIAIGLSFIKEEAISIPLMDLMSPKNPNGISLDEMYHMWKMVSNLLMSDKISKVGQNFKFDQGKRYGTNGDVLRTCLRGIGLDVRNFSDDIMLKFHSLYPEFPKRLGFTASILTEEPYYKDEGREYDPKKDDIRKLLIYNARDAAVTREIDDVLEPELDEYGVREFYKNHLMKMHDLYDYIESQGILCDEVQRQKMIEKYETKRAEVTKFLQAEAGFEINPDSNPQVCNFIYNELRCPQRVRRRRGGHSTLTADEKALMSLLTNVIKDERRRKILSAFMEHRACGKTLSTYLGKPKEKKSRLQRFYADKDGRVRTSYLIAGAETFRTSTNMLDPPERPDVYGLSYQTINKHSSEGRDIRSCFIPEYGYCFIEADQSQAESRIALLLAEEYELLKWMDVPGNDLHLLRASWALEDTYEHQKEIYKAGDDTYRQIGKHTGHANDNGVGKKRIVEMLFDFSGGEIQISEYRAGKYLENINQHSPGIRDVFHAAIKQCMSGDRSLIDPFGAKRTFFEKYGDELFKQAYAHIKQSTVTHKTQKAALEIHEKLPWLRILLEWHDSLLFECPIGVVDDVIPIIHEAFERPIDFSRCSIPRGELVIPCEIKISYTRWSEMRNYDVH